MVVSRRLRRRVTAFAVATAVTVLAPQSAFATTYLSEGWETAGAGWLLDPTTTTLDCTTAHTGLCSLQVSPATTGYRGKATRAVTVPLSAARYTSASFWFRNAGTTGHVDSDLRLVVGSAAVTLHVTDGAGTNNGVRLYSTSGSSTYVGTWPSANTWYFAEVRFDSLLGVVAARLGSTSSFSPWLAYSGTAINGIEIEGVDWGGGTPLHYDDLYLAQ